MFIEFHNDYVLFSAYSGLNKATGGYNDYEQVLNELPVANRTPVKEHSGCRF
jgi:hypothetical protein